MFRRLIASDLGVVDGAHDSHDGHAENNED